MATIQYNALRVGQHYATYQSAGHKTVLRNRTNPFHLEFPFHYKGICCHFLGYMAFVLNQKDNSQIAVMQLPSRLFHA